MLETLVPGFESKSSLKLRILWLQGLTLKTRVLIFDTNSATSQMYLQLSVCCRTKLVSEYDIIRSSTVVILHHFVTRWQWMPFLDLNQFSTKR